MGIPDAPSPTVLQPCHSSVNKGFLWSGDAGTAGCMIRLALNAMILWISGYGADRIDPVCTDKQGFVVLNKLTRTWIIGHCGWLLLGWPKKKTIYIFGFLKEVKTTFSFIYYLGKYPDPFFFLKMSKNCKAVFCGITSTLMHLSYLCHHFSWCQQLPQPLFSLV